MVEGVCHDSNRKNRSERILKRRLARREEEEGERGKDRGRGKGEKEGSEEGQGRGEAKGGKEEGRRDRTFPLLYGFAQSSFILETWRLEHIFIRHLSGSRVPVIRHGLR